MPRQPKPWLRKSTGTWYVQIKGERVALGPTRKEAFERFYALMGQPMTSLKFLYQGL